MGETPAKWTFYELSKQALEILTTSAECWHLEDCAALVSIFVSLSCTSPCTFGLSNKCTNSQMDYEKALVAVASRWRLQILKTICKGTGSVSQFISRPVETLSNTNINRKMMAGGRSQDKHFTNSMSFTLRAGHTEAYFVFVYWPPLHFQPGPSCISQMALFPVKGDRMCCGTSSV